MVSNFDLYMVTISWLVHTPKYLTQVGFIEFSIARMMLSVRDFLIEPKKYKNMGGNESKLHNSRKYKEYQIQ